MEQTFMKEKKILPLVLSMALPMVISMAVNSLYNIVDSYFVAQYSEDAMTALALVFPVQNLINAVTIGFGIGINAVTAFYLGAQQKEKADRAATQGVFLNFVQGVILAGLCIAAMPAFLRAFTPVEEIIRQALIYSNRAFLFAPVIAQSQSFEKIFKSVGSMKATLVCMMCGFVTNIVLDPLMNLALPSLLISALNGILAGFSEKYVLVLGVYYKLQTFIYLTANGIIQGVRPLVGYNYGAGEHQRVEGIFRTTLKLTAGVMLAGMVLLWLIPAQLIGLFTSSQETVRRGVTALHVISLGFVLSAVSVTCSGVLEGLGKGAPSLYISLARYVVVIIPAAFLFSRFAGADGVWYAFFFTEAVAAVFSYFIYRRFFAIIER